MFGQVYVSEMNLIKWHEHQSVRFLNVAFFSLIVTSTGNIKN